jgi:integrase/recombinase XerC
MLNKFLTYAISEKRFSEHTVIAYEKDLRQFLEFIELKSESEIKEIKSNVIRGWMVSLLENEYSAVSVHRKLSTLRTFFKWLQKEGFIQKDPMKAIAGPKVKKELPSFAQQGELLNEKIDPLFSDDFEGVRDRLMFEILYQTGIRSNELVNLKTKDVQNSAIKVLGKRNKERIIPIDIGLLGLINHYASFRSELELQTEFLVVLKSGKKLYPKLVYRKINSYLGMATGLRKKSPHVLRHTFATHMLNNGAELEVLKDILGHANLSATQVYTHNSFAQLTSIYSQSHPRGHKK